MCTLSHLHNFSTNLPCDFFPPSLSLFSILMAKYLYKKQSSYICKKNLKITVQMWSSPLNSECMHFLNRDIPVILFAREMIFFAKSWYHMQQYKKRFLLLKIVVLQNSFKDTMELNYLEFPFSKIRLVHLCICQRFFRSNLSSPHKFPRKVQVC